MPQRVMIIWSCSLCGTEADSDDKVTQYQLSGGGRTLGYDICTTCATTEPFAAFLAAGLSENAKGRSAPSSENGRVRCQFCEKSFTSQGMGLHLSLAHNVKSGTAALVEKRGKSGEHICEDCDFRARAATGLGAHRRAKHAVMGTSKTATENRRAKKAPAVRRAATK